MKYYITDSEKDTIITYLCMAIKSIEDGNENAESILQELVGIVEDGLICYEEINGK